MSTYNSIVDFNPSETAKDSNSQELAKKIIDGYADISISPERIQRLRENIELHSGRWSEIENLSTGKSITIHTGDEESESETFTIGDLKIRHYDKIGRVTRGLQGQIIATPMVAIIKDISSKSKSLRDKIKVEAVKDILYNKYILPKEEIVTQQELAKIGVDNIFMLDPDQQQQLHSQISARVMKESPEEIMSALEKVKTPDEQVCQLLFNYTASQINLKYKYDTGGEFAIVNGEEYYRPYILNGLPTADVLIPEKVVWGGSPNIEFVEDGSFATYSQALSIEDVIKRFGIEFFKEDIDNLEQYYTGEFQFGSTSLSFSNRVENNLVEIIGKDEKLSQTNFLTREGQQVLNGLYSRINGQVANYKIPHRYVTWQWTTRMKLVTRLVNGKPQNFIVAGHYTKNPRTDIKCRTIIVPQVWEGEKLGKDWYVNIKRKEYQYTSIQNPFNVKLGIFGGQYNTLLGTTKNYSLVDNGKVWNYKYNLAMARKDEIESTNLGRILFLTLNSKPQNMRWEDFINGIIVNKIGIISTNGEVPISQEDKKTISSVDLGRLTDIAGVIQDLQYCESELNKSMYFTGALLGDIGQYSTNQNTQAQLDAANLQLMPFLARHRAIIRNVSQELLKLSLIAYRDNEIVKDSVLDDFLKTHYEVNMKNEDIGQYALTLLDTQSEVIAVKRMTDLALSFVQNGIISLRELSRLFSCETMAEAQDIIDEAESKREKKEEQSYQQQKQLEAERDQIKKDLIKMKQDFDAMQNDLDRKVKVTLAEISSHLLSNANDIDGNKINDAFQRAIIETQSKEKINREKLASDERIADKQLKSNK